MPPDIRRITDAFEREFKAAGGLNGLVVEPVEGAIVAFRASFTPKWNGTVERVTAVGDELSLILLAGMLANCGSVADAKHLTQVFNAAQDRRRKRQLEELAATNAEEAELFRYIMARSVIVDEGNVGSLHISLRVPLWATGAGAFDFNDDFKGALMAHIGANA